MGGTRRKIDVRATAPDTDILREIVCVLTQRVRAGRATFLIKVKLIHGEPINERADTLVEEGREISYDDKRWDDRTDQMMFEVWKGSTTVLSVWTNRVRNAFRKQAGWAKLQEATAAAKHWTERVWYCHNQRWLQTSRAGTEASQSGSFKDEQDWGKKCFEDLDQWRMGRPVTCMMIVLLLFLQKQSLAFAVYLFGIGTLHTGPGLKKKTHVIMLSP
jgi:hypothetical protein